MNHHGPTNPIGNGWLRLSFTGRWPRDARAWYGLFALLAGIALIEMGGRLHIYIPAGPVMLACIIFSVLWGGWQAGAVNTLVAALYYAYFQRGGSSAAMSGTVAVQVTYFLVMVIAVVLSAALRRRFQVQARMLLVRETDAARQRQIAADLRENEARLRELADAMPQIVWSFDAQGTLHYANRRWGQYTGLAKETMRARDLLHCIHPDDRAACRAVWRRSLTQQGGGRVMARLRRHDGSYHWHLAQLEPVHDAEGRLLRWYGTFTDIHEQKVNEERLANIQVRVNLAQKTAKACSWEMNLGEDAMVWSDECFTLFGQSPENFIPTIEGWTKLVDPRDVDVFREFHAALREGKDFSFDYRIQHPQQGERWMAVRGTVQRNGREKGRVIGMMLDITDLKHAVAAAQRAEGRLLRIMENSPAAIGVLDYTWRYIYLNTRLMDELGNPAPMPIGKLLWEAAPWPVTAEMEQAARAAVLLHEACSFELQSPDGRQWFQVHITPAAEEILVMSTDVTAIRQAAATEERVYALLDNVTDAIGAFDRQWRFIYVNERMLENLNCTRESLMGKSLREVSPWLWTESMERQLYLAIETQRTRDFEFMIPDTEQWLHLRFLPTPDATLMFTSDISERKRVEAALQRSENQFAAIFNQASVGMAQLDVHGRFLMVNRRYGEMLDRPPASLINHFPEEYTHPEDQQLTRREIAKLMAGQPYTAFEKRYLRPDGSIAWVSKSLALVRDADQKPLFLVMVTQDISEQRRAMQALMESEERFRTMADAAPVLIWVSDPTGDYSFFNLPWLQFTGRTMEQEAGAGWWQGVHPEDAAQCRQTCEENFGNGRPFSMEYRLRRHDGEYRWMLHKGVPRWSDDGVFLGYIGSCLDITDLRDALERMQHSNEQLEVRVAERTAMAEQRTAQLRLLAAELTQAEQRERRRLAQLLHDHLQQLLVAAKLQVGIAHARAQQQPRDDLGAALHKIADLIDQSIQSSRSLTQELSPPVLYDAGLIPALHWLAQWMEEKHGLKVSLNLKASGEPPLEDSRAFLFQAARELLFNVVKHSGTLTAEVSLAAEGDEIRLEVADHGRGAPQGLETRPPRTDAGFGLFSIRERLQVLDGKMSIHSTAGEGMRIVLRLPLTTPSATQASSMVYESAQRVMRPHAPAPGSAVGRMIRILLVDDHEIMRAGLASLLQDDPTIRIVGEAGNGAQALELARSTRPDLILMDVSMPTMDGVEATRQILHEIPTALIVGLSVHDEVGRAEAMRASGACGYLPKGCPADQLLAAIHKYADHTSEPPCRD